MDDENKSASDSTPLFTVIVLHYNQQNYIEEALDSVFIQDYANIELIIADDATPGIDTYSIESYAEKHRTRQITSVQYLFNKENQGTVKNVNHALREAKGQYAMFFAADDSLYNDKVLSSFVKVLSMLPSNQYMVCAQCAMMDEKMEQKLGDFVNSSLALRMNDETPMEQYRKIAFSCCYAMGSTAFKMEILKNKGFFDEKYKIIEDWSYYLNLTIGGSKIIYSDFNALRHRDGGVSHFNREILPPHVIEYKNDSLLIQENLILPYLSSFPLLDQVKLSERYDSERENFARLFTGKPRPSKISIMMQNKKLYRRKTLWWLTSHVPVYRHKSIAWLKYLLPIWALLNFISIILNVLPQSQQLMIVNMQAYHTITTVIFILLIAFLIISVCLTFISALLFIRKKGKKLFSRN